jgi:hypothetical protein
MAKISFTKLGLKQNQDIKTIEFNEQTIEVKQYLPVSEKLEIISRILTLSQDDNNFENSIKINVYTALEILYAYTNITFTDKQKEDAPKLYDVVYSSGLYEAVKNAIPEDEYDDIVYGASSLARAYYKYKSSAMGILENISTDYSNLSFDATDIQQKISDPNNLALLKDIMTKLG